MNVLVTGGAGYAGSVLVRNLLLEGYGILCVDNLRYGQNSLPDISAGENFTFIKCDITDRKLLKEIVNRNPFYAVVHLAAIVGDPACKREPDVARKVNWEASKQLFELAVERCISRFIFASTCSNYGKMANPDSYVDETSPLAPVSLYAELKVKVEELLLDRKNGNSEFCPTSLRFSTIYGMSPRMRFDLTVNEFTKEMALGRELVVFGEQFWRPYCHVQDYSLAILQTLKAPKETVAYNVFNVGDTNENYTKKMIVDELLRVIPDGKVRYTKIDEDPRDYRVSFKKIRDSLGFKAAFTVPDGISEIIDVIRAGVIANYEDPRFYNTPH